MSDVAPIDLPDLEHLSREELIELVEAHVEGGIRVTFSGKANARQIARKVRPRITTTVAKYSVGSPEDQATNLIMEGDNLQGMATLYRERGQVVVVPEVVPRVVWGVGDDDVEAAVTGASTKELMRRLGHASSDAALRYQHATTNRDEDIAQALSELARGDQKRDRAERDEGMCGEPGQLPDTEPDA